MLLPDSALRLMFASKNKFRMFTLGKKKKKTKDKKPTWAHILALGSIFEGNELKQLKKIPQPGQPENLDGWFKMFRPYVHPPH